MLPEETGLFWISSSFVEGLRLVGRQVEPLAYCSTRGSCRRVPAISITLPLRDGDECHLIGLGVDRVLISDFADVDLVDVVMRAFRSIPAGILAPPLCL